MNIARFTFNPFQENTYVVWDEGGECAIIDAGNYTAREDEALREFISSKGLRPVVLLATHGHVDHILGVERLRRHYGIPFAVHGDDAFLVESVVTHAQIYGFDVAEAPVIDTDLKGRGEVDFGATTLSIIHTPGHTPGHVCFFNAADKVLFSGDTLFKESIGRTDLPGGDYGWIMRSIIDRILPLGEEVAFHPGHGPQSTLGHEMRYNPFVVEVMEGEVVPR